MSDEKENLNDTAALRSLAMSLDDNHASEEEVASLNHEHSEAEGPVDTDDFFKAAAEGNPAEVEELETVYPEEREELVRVESAPKRQNSAAIGQIQTLRRTIQTRKIGIPILSSISVILFFIAGATLYQANNAMPEQIEGNPLLANAGLFAAICIFLGASLVGGAGFFLFEISRYNASIKKLEASLH